MKYRTLGKTGLRVSAVSLGTVELGIDYGLHRPGQSERPEPKEAMRLLLHAADQGINLFDTAPAYGGSEELLGETLGRRQDCYFATKVSVPPRDAAPSARAVQEAVTGSIETSLKALRRDGIDIVQVHNATVEALENGSITEALEKARDAGKIRFLGASVYGEEAAMAALGAEAFDLVQVAYNLLDQQMADGVFPAAHRAGKGVICRSALLKGALTERAEFLPGELAPLREQAEKAVNTLAGSWQRLPETALRFCLSSPDIHTVLVGVSSGQELDAALEAVAAGPLDKGQLELAAGLALADERLTNPSYWPVP